MKNKQHVKNRYEYFLKVGMSPEVAMHMAEFEYPNGVYFRTPSYVDD